VNWEIWRVVTSKHMRVTLGEMRQSWTILDLFDAHCLIDAFDAADAEARANAQRT